MMEINYFDTMLRAQKGYSRMLEPVCKKWALTRNELDILLFLHNHPGLDRAADIVSRRGIAKSHVSLSVSSLEKRGLLCRRFDPADRRTARLELTAQAVEIAGEGRNAQQRFFTRIFRGLSQAEFAQWRQITQKVRHNIEDMDQ